MRILSTRAMACSALGLTAMLAGSVQADAIIYDGFEDLSDTTLNGNDAGLGLTGNWSASSTLTSGSLTYGSLLTSGGRVITTPGDEFQTNNANPGSTLTGAGLMSDGAELWFSVLLVHHRKNPTADPASNDYRTYFSLGTGGADGFDRVGGGSGAGFTLAMNKIFVEGVGGVTAQAWNDGSDGAGGATRGATDTSIATGATFLAVGKITWGEFGVVDDKFELFLPGTDLVQPLAAISTIEADFDQLGAANAANAFNTISVAGGRERNDVPEFDEIRFGATYADVTPVPEPGSLALLGLGGLLIARRRRA